MTFLLASESEGAYTNCYGEAILMKSMVTRGPRDQGAGKRAALCEICYPWISLWAWKGLNAHCTMQCICSPQNCKHDWWSGLTSYMGCMNGREESDLVLTVEFRKFMVLLYRKADAVSMERRTMTPQKTWFFMDVCD